MNTLKSCSRSGRASERREAGVGYIKAWEIQERINGGDWAQIMVVRVANVALNGGDVGMWVEMKGAGNKMLVVPIFGWVENVISPLANAKYRSS